MGLTISVVTPVYRGSGTIEELWRRLAEVADTMDTEFEFVFVDDASPDDTWTVLRGIAERDDRVVAVRLEWNAGQIRALFAGGEVAKGDAMLIMDSDLEDRPESIPALVADYLAGHDLVVASRGRRGQSLTRRIGSLAVRIAGRASGLPISDLGSAFLIVDRYLVEDVARPELERTGTHLLLPFFWTASRNPTTRKVRSSEVKQSNYSLGTLFGIGVEFLATYAARRMAKLFLAAATVGGLVSMSRSTPRRWRPALVWLAAGNGVLSIWLFRVAGDRTRDRSRPLYEIAERIG